MTIHIAGTNQEVFDRVCVHLARQGRRAATAGGKCLYQTEEGRRCAIGCLFPDDAPFAALDEGGLTAVGLIDEGTLTADVNPRFLGSLQKAHDFNIDPLGLRIALRDIAADYDLNPAAADTIKVWE
jgi:hypothetical protein